MKEYREYLSELNDMLLRNGVDLGIEEQIKEGTLEEPILILEQYFEFNKSLAISDSDKAISVGTGEGNLLYNNLLYKQLQEEYEETIKGALALLYSEEVDDNPMSEEELFHSRIDAFNEYLRESKELSNQGTPLEESDSIVLFNKSEGYSGLSCTVESVIEDTPVNSSDLYKSYDEINAENGVGTDIEDYDDSIYTEVVDDEDDDVVEDNILDLDEEEDSDEEEDLEEEEDSEEEEDLDDVEDGDFVDFDEEGDSVDLEEDEYEDDTLDFDEEEEDNTLDLDEEDDSVDLSEDDSVDLDEDDTVDSEDGYDDLIAPEAGGTEEEDYEDGSLFSEDEDISLEDIDGIYEDEDEDSGDLDVFLEEEGEDLGDVDEDYEDDSILSEEEDDSLEDEDEDYEDDSLFLEDEEDEEEMDDSLGYEDEEGTEDEEEDEDMDLSLPDEEEDTDDSIPDDEDEDMDFSLPDEEETDDSIPEDEDDMDFSFPDVDDTPVPPPYRVQTPPLVPAAESMVRGTVQQKKDANDCLAESILWAGGVAEKGFKKLGSRFKQKSQRPSK